MQIDNNILKNDERIACMLRALYRRLGYCQYKMSKFEEYALYVKNKDFLVSDGIISFTDTNGRLLALKPDVTLSIINNSKDIQGQTQKLYYDENVYRISGSSHTYKEIRQTGLECIGDITDFEICEVLLLATRSLELISDNYILEISHMGLLESILDELSLSSPLKSEILACIGSKNSDGLASLCKDKELGDEALSTLSVFFKRFDDFDLAIEALGAVCKSKSSRISLDEFASVLDFAKQAGLGEKIKVDFSLTNNMGYYSGVIFRGYIAGIPTGVLSGGQYDKLMQKMGRSSGAVGFAVYLDALERMGNGRPEYDIDTLIIHGSDILAALSLAERLSADGKVVRVSRETPIGITFREIVDLSERSSL